MSIRLSHATLLCLILGNAIRVSADSNSLQLIEIERGRGAFIANLRRRNATATSTFSADTNVFNLTLVMAEVKTVVAKYAQAAQFLAGIGLNPDTHAAEGYPPFKPPGSLLQVVGNNSTSSNGSAYEDDTAILGFAGAAQIPLTDWVSDGLDILYYGPLQFGSQAESLTVDIDTGSADLWVPMQCKSCSNHEFYGSESTSFQSLGTKISVAYGEGRVSGTLVQDTVAVGDLSISDQAFLAVSNESLDFAEEPSDGLLGLAFGTIARSHKPTFFENLLSQKKLAAGIFSVYLTRGQQSGSQICFGCFDATKTNGPVSWVPLVSQTYWSISMESISPLQGQSVSTNLTAAVDTGTSLVYVPDSVASQFYALIPGSQSSSQFGPGFYTFPCSAPMAVSMSFSGQTFSIDMRDFNLGLTGEGSSDCVGGILGLGSGFPESLAIVGDEFLKSYYSVFDYAGARIGFAPVLDRG